MKLERISVKKLFGMYDYCIDLFMNESVTIINALNGKGKTTVLKLIKAVVEGDIYMLDQIPFESFSLFFNNGDEISVKKRDIYGSIKKLNVEQFRSLKLQQYENIEFSINSNVYGIQFRSDYVSFILRRMRSYGRDMYDREGDSNNSYIEEIVGMGNDIFECEELIGNLSKFSESLKIHFIKADRLYLTPQNMGRHSKQDREEKQSSVERYSDKIKEEITTLGKKFGDESEKLDRTFPKRVIDGIFRNTNGKEVNILSKDQIIYGLSKLEERRHELGELGLITETKDFKIDIPQNDELSRDTRVFLTYYIEDNTCKLDIYKELAKKLELLKSIVNTRNGFSDKEMKFTKDGVIFVNIAGENIPVDYLSSGEKNDFILFYELIFNCKPESLILVDEPEISLHVAWQQEFIDELLDICEMKNMQAIVATHSPNIVSNHWDLLEDLEEDKL